MCKVTRRTSETDITAVFMKKGSPCMIQTDFPLFSHMLQAFCCHGGFALEITASGDVQVDPHHLLEDTGYVLGKLFKKSFSYAGILRSGCFTFPMDDALVTASVDMSGRPFCSWEVKPEERIASGVDIGAFREFYRGFCRGANCNLHVLLHYGIDPHHSLEASFKAFGKALAEALTPSDFLRSTKGAIDD